MLVITRLPGESILIGDDIEIMLLRIEKNGATIGIQAPQAVSVHRQEVYDAIRSGTLRKLEEKMDARENG